MKTQIIHVLLKSGLVGLLLLRPIVVHLIDMRQAFRRPTRNAAAIYGV